MDHKDKVAETIASVGISRRTTTKALALGSLAAFAGLAISTPAYAANQAGWRWCSKCEGMFYRKDTHGPNIVGGTSTGACPAGGGHNDSASGKYFERVGEDGRLQQGGWRWCRKCEGLFYRRDTHGANLVGGSSTGVCPTGGGHDDSASGHYAAIIGEDITGKQQGGWRWCRKCEGMFYARASAGKGNCPADHQPHDDSASGHYASLI